METREILKALHARGSLIPWLNGETECYYSGNLVTLPKFTGDPDNYTFRPVPKPSAKVLRTWTAKELWEHRDCWFRRKMIAEAYQAIHIGPATITFYGSAVDVLRLRTDYEYLADDGETWLPCGVWEEQ